MRPRRAHPSPVSRHFSWCVYCVSFHLRQRPRGIWLMHLRASTSYVEQRPAPQRPPASPCPLSSPDLVYLIDFRPVGHLYNAEPDPCVCACVWSSHFVQRQRIDPGEGFNFLFFNPTLAASSLLLYKMPKQPNVLFFFSTLTPDFCKVTPPHPLHPTPSLQSFSALTL